MNEQLKNNLTPFWASGFIYNESLTMTEGENGAIEAPLMFQPECILTVRSATLENLYEEGKDWVFRDGKICLVPGSAIPFFTKEQLYPAAKWKDKFFPHYGAEGYILFEEGNYFHRHQIAVTYTCKKGQWDGLIPQYAGNQLSRTIRCLRRGKQLKMVLFGDSISAGYNASSFGDGAPPYLPCWGEMIAEGLRDHYAAEVEFMNPSVGGMTSQWGMENAEKLVAQHEPDLVLIGFGMNDGTNQTPPEKFRQNIQAIMDTVRHANPDAEFILIATIVPNKEAGVDRDHSFWGEQVNYLPQLKEICKTKQAALADMTTLHLDLLKRKRFIDMTGNNVNHPNDFLSRWYAQFILAMLKD